MTAGAVAAAPRRGHVGWMPYIVMAVVLVVALAIGASQSTAAKSDSDRVFALSRTIACPTCDGQSVAESESPLAREIRADIAVRVEEGQTDDQIRDYYVATQGQEILLNPPSTGVAGIMWVIPVLGGVLALAALVAVFARWKRRPQVHATADDREVVARALGGDG